MMVFPVPGMHKPLGPAVDFHIWLAGESESDLVSLKLPRTAALTAEQRPRVLCVDVLGDDVPNNFFEDCTAMTTLGLSTRLARIGHEAFAGVVGTVHSCVSFCSPAGIGRGQLAEVGWSGGYRGPQLVGCQLPQRGPGDQQPQRDPAGWVGPQRAQLDPAGRAGPWVWGGPS
jgi:hypothetical protein